MTLGQLFGNPMAYFAKISNGIVEQVISINNSVIGEPEKIFPETEQSGISYILNTLGLDGEWKQTSYNRSFRGNYASVGCLYDSNKDIFIPPNPFPSWIWDDQGASWVAPLSYPTDGGFYYWDELNLMWREMDK